jgi:tRNA threonylcarbamoyladenosine biosynthesis protein TsaE
MVEEITTRSEAETEALGARLWKTLQTPDLVLLDAPLGVGKTALARGLVRAAGHEGEVPSPTFAIVQAYETRPPLYHLDLYRLNHPSELSELGLEDMLDTGVVLIEWPGLADGLLPQGAVRVTGRIGGGGERVWTVAREGA